MRVSGQQMKDPLERFPQAVAAASSQTVDQQSTDRGGASLDSRGDASSSREGEQACEATHAPSGSEAPSLTDRMTAPEEIGGRGKEGETCVGEAAADSYCASGAEGGGNVVEAGGSMGETGGGCMGCGKADCETAIAWARSSQAAAESRLQALIADFEQQRGKLEEERAVEREGHQSAVREMEGIIKALQRKLEDTADQLRAASSEYSAAAADLEDTMAAQARLEAEHSELQLRVRCLSVQNAKLQSDGEALSVALDDSRKRHAALESSSSSLQREHAAISEDLRARMIQQERASVHAARVLAFMFAGMARCRLQNVFNDFVLKATSPAEKAVARASAKSSQIELRAAGIAQRAIV